jgi:DNA-directed RNA polymerase subunit A"
MCAYGATHITILKKDGNIFKGKISEFMDPFFKGSDNGELISEAVDVSGNYIVSVCPTGEKTSWSEISQVSRHPANGGLVKVTTKSGKTTTATLSHSFLKRTKNGIAPVLGSDLKVGNRIPVAKFIPTVENPLDTFGTFKLTKDFGWLIGAYLADGNVNSNEISISKIIPEFSQKVIDFAKSINCTAKYKYRGKRPNTFGPEGKTTFSHEGLAELLVTQFGHGSANKHIASFVFGSNLEFISGIISGYFDGDGNVNSMIGKQMIRSSSISEQLTIDMIGLLSYNGIFASKCVEKKKNHTIQIPRKYARTFKEKIGLVVKKKSNALDDIIKYVEREDAHSQCEFIDKIPETGEILAQAGKKIGLPSRTYGRYTKKESIGRETLVKYIKQLTESDTEGKIINEIEKLKQAAYSDVVWDEIISLDILDDPKEYVYDFTVPGNQSFMVDCGVLVHNTLNTLNLMRKVLC